MGKCLKCEFFSVLSWIQSSSFLCKFKWNSSMLQLIKKGVIWSEKSSQKLFVVGIATRVFNYWKEWERKCCFWVHSMCKNSFQSFLRFCTPTTWSEQEKESLVSLFYGTWCDFTTSSCIQHSSLMSIFILNALRLGTYGLKLFTFLSAHIKFKKMWKSENIFKKCLCLGLHYM